MNKLYKYTYCTAAQKKEGFFLADEVRAGNNTLAMKEIRRKMRERNAGLKRPDKFKLLRVWRQGWIPVYRNGRL